MPLDVSKRHIVQLLKKIDNNVGLAQVNIGKMLSTGTVKVSTDRAINLTTVSTYNSGYTGYVVASYGGVISSLPLSYTGEGYYYRIGIYHSWSCEPSTSLFSGAHSIIYTPFPQLSHMLSTISTVRSYIGADTKIESYTGYNNGDLTYYTQYSQVMYLSNVSYYGLGFNNNISYWFSHFHSKLS